MIPSCSLTYSLLVHDLFNVHDLCICSFLVHDLLLVHALLTSFICPSRLVHYLITTCSQYFYGLSMICSHFNDKFFIISSWLVHCLSLLSHELFITCLRLIHDLFTIFNDSFMTGSLCGWLVHNLFMNCLRLLYYLLMNHSWLVYNFFMNCSWLVHQLVHNLSMTCLQLV